MSFDITELVKQYIADFQGQSLQPPIDPSISTLAAQPPVTSISTTESDAGLYDIYRVETRYIQDPGKLLLAVSTGGTTRIAKVSEPYGFKLVMFEVARANAFPKLPAIEESDSWQLLGSQIGTLNDVFDAITQHRIYRTTGSYLYGAVTPLVPGVDNFPVPSLPNISSKSLPLEPSDFQEGIAPVESDGTTWSE